MTKLPVIFLMGPTASGKTDLAINLRKHLPVDIISVDSTLVYRGLDIGSAKPSAEELAQAPHRLIDIRDPSEPYSAAEFCDDALTAIEEIHQANRIPLLVGGTMLYFNVLLKGLADLPASDPAVRARIEADARKLGWSVMHQRLAAIDPETAARLHPNHSQRIARALEIFEVSGSTMSQLHQTQRQQSGSQPTFSERFALTQLGLAPQQRALLHQRIAHRYEQMLILGFEEEVKALRQRGDLSEDLPAVRAVGYRQMWEYLDGKTSYDEMVQRGIAATRQLAKRQLTWLRSWPDLCWINLDNERGEVRPLMEMCDQALSYFQRTAI